VKILFKGIPSRTLRFYDLLFNGQYRFSPLR